MPSDADPPNPPPMPPAGAASARTPEPEVAIVNSDYLHVKGADYEGVIAQTRGTWTPSPRDVADVERALGPALAAHAELGPAGPTSRWKRQYTGVEIEGKRAIQIQLACKVDGWPVDGVPSVRGGGTCYGVARYDVATASITQLAANSPR